MESNGFARCLQNSYGLLRGIQNNNVIIRDVPNENYMLRKVIISANAEPCGGYLSGQSGWLAQPDDNDDGFYNVNADCLWTIELHGDKVVKITFVDMNLDCFGDFITVSCDFLNFSGTSTNVHSQQQAPPQPVFNIPKVQFFYMHVQ